LSFPLPYRSKATGKKPWSKTTWSSRLWVDAAGQPPAYWKKKIAKKNPLEIYIYTQPTAPKPVHFSLAGYFCLTLWFCQ